MLKMKKTSTMLILFFLVLANLSLHGNEVSSKKECVVFVCNKAYFNKFLHTLSLLTTKGNYQGDICLVIGDDLLNDFYLNCQQLKKNHVIVKHFPEVPFPDHFLQAAQGLPRFKKLFQYHKLYVFSTYFKKWDTVFYIDCGMNIESDIRPMLNLREPGILLAHSDSYPSFSWKLSGQFKQEEKYFPILSNEYHLDIDYFQTGILLFDTAIIQENTFENLLNLAVKYPISNTNEQGIMALYFTNIIPCWKPLPIRNENTYFYDYCKREPLENYIMWKY